MEFADCANNIDNSKPHDYKMIQEKIGNVTIERYDDIDELIITNYNLFNEYAVMDSEVGSDLSSIEKHFHKLDFFLSQKKIEEAIQARKNQHQNFYHLLFHNNFPALQWAAMLKSIDGEPIPDYSLNSLKLILEGLSKEGLTQGKVKTDVEAAKKKYKSPTEASLPG